MQGLHCQTNVFCLYRQISELVFLGLEKAAPDVNNYYCIQPGVFVRLRVGMTWKVPVAAE